MLVRHPLPSNKQMRHLIQNFQDVLWQHQTLLCETVLSKMLNDWCVSGNTFPTRDAVAVVLHLLSSRSNTYDFSTSDVSQRLKLGPPESEYELTWPNRTSHEAAALVGALSEIILTAVGIWESRGVAALSIRALMNSVVAEVLAQRYVTLHHYETTRWDPRFRGT
jgi:hypothetical protein